MISKKLDTKPTKMLKIELSEEELIMLKRAVGSSGMKQQSWLRSAVLEKIANEGKNIYAFDNH
jgi:predicted DNA binding CopG/RHH family protein